MPVNPYSGGSLQLTRARLDLFVGRETELKALRRFLVDVGSGSAKERIVHVFGAAGTGKSFLLAKLRADVATADAARLAVLDVDTDAFDPQTPASDLLWHLRFALRRAGVRTPLYDLFYVTSFTKHVLPGVSISLTGLIESLGKTSEPVEKVTSAASSKALGSQLADVFDAEFIKDVAEGAGEIAKGTKGFQLFAKLVSAFQKKAQRRALKTQGIDLTTPGVKDMQALAPEILASDLLEFAAATSPLVIVIDGFDRIQTEPQVLRFPAVAESAFEALVRYVMFSPNSVARGRSGFLLFGRQRLRWAELFDQADDVDSWDTVVRQLPLRAFTQIEAEISLKKADRALDAAGEAAVAQALRASTQAVLKAAREQAEDTSGPPPEVRYSPFRLRLCVEEVSELKRPFSDEDARHHADDICASFLRSVPEALREAAHVFALAGEIDAAMYQTLVSQGVIRGFTVAEYPLLVQRDALFVPAAGGNAYRLHFQLEDAALTLLTQSAGSRQIAAAITAKIFDEHLRRATPPTFAHLTNAHLDAYQQAMRLIFRVYEARLLPIERFAAAFLELEETLDNDVAVGGVRHKAWLRRLFERSARWTVDDGRQLVNSQLRTRFGKRARQIVQQMVLHFHAGWVGEAPRAAAKTMFTRMYGAGVFPPADGEPADAEILTTIAVKRARTTAAQFAERDEFGPAEATLQQAMQSLPATLQSAEKAGFEGDLYLDLAQIAIKKRDKAQAETLLDRALSLWRAANLERTALAQRILEYCIAMLSYIGKEAQPAAGLLEEIAPVLEGELPPLHPTRADLATTFAMLCLQRGLAALALPYLETAKEILVANYGADDPRVRAHESLIDDVRSEL